MTTGRTLPYSTTKPIHAAAWAGFILLWVRIQGKDSQLTNHIKQNYCCPQKSACEEQEEGEA